MITSGFSKAYTFRTRVGRYSSYKQAESEARAGGRGVYAVLGVRPWRPTREAIGAFLTGYDGAPDDLHSWTRLSVIRLAALAETRHRDGEQARLLLDATDLDPQVWGRSHELRDGVEVETGDAGDAK